jgi:hypothetical protein
MHHNYSGVEIKNGAYTQVITKTLYNSQVSIVEVGNRDKFPDFGDLLFFGE